MDPEPDIPFARIASFVRRHTHDLRNVLNSLDLETGLVEELVSEEDARASIQRMRTQVRTLTERMRALSSVFRDPEPIAASIDARELFHIWREQHASLADAPEVGWSEELHDEKVNVDVEMMATIFRELLSNARSFAQGGPATITARRDRESVVFELREPKSEVLDPSAWGQAFSSTRESGLGLGLWSARRLMRANGATLVHVHDTAKGELVTRLELPVA